MSKQNEGFTDRLTEGIFYTIGFVIGLFFRFLKLGLVYAKTNKVILIIYIVFIAVSFAYQPLIPITLLIILSVGVWQHIKEAPTRKMRNYFNQVFDEIGLLSNGQPPNYVRREEISEYVSSTIFYNLVPLSDWNKKKEQLELYINVSIIDVKQDIKDNRYIFLLIENQPLPHHIKWNNSYLDYNHDILNIGHSYFGLVGIDLEKYPHAFIAGETGSGKSNILKCMIYQAIKKDYEITLIDFKRGVAFSKFQDVVPIYYEYQETLEELKNIIIEIKQRLDLFRKYGVEKLNEYNKYVDISLKRRIIFIDEVAELLSVRDKELSRCLYDSIETITRISRAVGIHLIMGIQRPDSTIINGQIKSNVPYRICGHFVDKEPSRIMLGNDKASTIKNIKGRFIVKDDNINEVQCFYYEDDTFKPRREDIVDNVEDVNEKKKEASSAIKTASHDGKINTPSSNTINFNFNDIIEK